MILFTDEACFTRKGVTNLHNEHVYAEENPHATRATHYRHEFSVNVWASTILLLVQCQVTNLGNGYQTYLHNALVVGNKNTTTESHCSGIQRDSWTAVKKCSNCVRLHVCLHREAPGPQASKEDMAGS
ncbi:hypothetical protein ILUMI_01209 [Ignelater luminosus]|uniref:Uncharacterized protein n=1 Tax=Ignelater luminosus TaxID=2038154 RepID=A0A8K0GMG4_IGNLU|nr:hypothetical protein ILUMI_01209 [Ignelater luminosus]